MASGGDLEWDSPEYRNEAFSALLRSTPRELTRQELAAAMPPRGPSGSTQNRVRGSRIRMLNNAGFTMWGERIR